MESSNPYKNSATVFKKAPKPGFLRPALTNAVRYYTVKFKNLLKWIFGLIL